jgi:hypothetical protein
MASSLRQDDAIPQIEGRPTVAHVRLSNTAWQTEAEVTLGAGHKEAIGEASGSKTPHGLKVVAEATVDAAGKLWGGDGDVVLKGVSIAETVGEELVLVVVSAGDDQKIGAALVNEDPIPDVTVRATLDALDRRLAGNV